jgi:hypothetical protein
MDAEPDRMSTGKPCPMAKANIFSFITWQWVQPLITAGNKKPLEVSSCLKPLSVPSSHATPSQQSFNFLFDGR